MTYGVHKVDPFNYFVWTDGHTYRQTDLWYPQSRPRSIILYGRTDTRTDRRTYGVHKVDPVQLFCMDGRTHVQTDGLMVSTK